jgi:hypothetical protein
MISLILNIRILNFCYRRYTKFPDIEDYYQSIGNSCPARNISRNFLRKVKRDYGSRYFSMAVRYLSRRQMNRDYF